MSIIEQAAKRLEELQRAGVDVPWAAAGLSRQEFDSLVDSAQKAPAVPGPGNPAGLHLARPSPGAEAVGVAPAAPVASDMETGERRSRSIELPLATLGQSGFLVPGQARTGLADEFRVIKRPLIKNIEGESAAPIERANLILVTSAMPGEGKTFTAINLALSIAMEVDKTVLLVDADVVRPSLMSRLGVDEPAKGLLDVLTDPELDLSEVLLRTNVPKLTLLPAGSQCANSTELLASTGMERLLDELASKYADRIVVFDAPPLLPTTESRVLAARAGQVVMVVEADHTSRNTVEKAFATVESCPVVMSVLNKCRDVSTTNRYGYY